MTELLRFEVCYFAKNDDEVTVEVEAEDAACALGLVLDGYADDIMEGAPFVVDLIVDDDDDDGDGEDAPAPEKIVEQVEVVEGGAKIIQLFRKVGT